MLGVGGTGPASVSHAGGVGGEASGHVVGRQMGAPLGQFGSLQDAGGDRGGTGVGGVDHDLGSVVTGSVVIGSALGVGHLVARG